MDVALDVGILEPMGLGENDVGKLSGGVHAIFGDHQKVQLLEPLPDHSAVRMGDGDVGARDVCALHPIGLAVMDGTPHVGVVRKHGI